MVRGERAKRPTSRDVARLAGVSQTTVSFIINEVPHVSITEETRERVRDAIARLDYHPHEGARSLSRRTTRSLGLIFSEAANPHMLQIAEGVDAYAERHGYGVALAVTNFDLRRERRSLGWLKQQRCDALIVAFRDPTALLDEMHALCRQGYPITTLGFYDEDMDSVGPEREAGERLVLEHLAALGHRRIGYIYGVHDHNVPRDRLSACLAVQRELGLPVVTGWIRRCGPTPEEGYEATRALLDDCAGAGPDRPTALVVVNDYLAIAVLAALHAAGVAVPGDVSVASFDNTPLARYTAPALTSVDQHAHTMGELAARLTIERLADPDRSPAHLGTQADLVARASSGLAPAS